MIFIVLAPMFMLSVPALAVDPWTPGANAVPSYTPRLETPGIYKPVIPGQPGYSGFDASRVCDNPSLGAADQASCRLDMNTVATDAQRNQIRQRYDLRLAVPPPPVSAAPPVGSGNDPRPEGEPEVAPPPQ